MDRRVDGNRRGTLQPCDANAEFCGGDNPSVRAAGDGGAESGVGDSLAGRVCVGGAADYAEPRFGNPEHHDIRRRAGFGNAVARGCDGHNIVADVGGNPKRNRAVLRARNGRNDGDKSGVGGDTGQDDGVAGVHSVANKVQVRSRKARDRPAACGGRLRTGAGPRGHARRQTQTGGERVGRFAGGRGRGVRACGQNRGGAARRALRLRKSAGF